MSICGLAPGATAAPSSSRRRGLSLAQGFLIEFVNQDHAAGEVDAEPRATAEGQHRRSGDHGEEGDRKFPAVVGHPQVASQPRAEQGGNNEYGREDQSEPPIYAAGFLGGRRRWADLIRCLSEDERRQRRRHACHKINCFLCLRGILGGARTGDNPFDGAQADLHFGVCIFVDAQRHRVFLAVDVGDHTVDAAEGHDAIAPL